MLHRDALAPLAAQIGQHIIESYFLLARERFRKDADDAPVVLAAHREERMEAQPP